MSLTGLYLITGRLPAAGGRLLGVIEAALKGGVRLIQLREKDLPARELLALAVEAADMAHRYGARLLVNERADVAMLSGADGVHLTSTGYSPADARRLLGAKALIGASTHSVEEALRAQEQGADFVTFGPVFPTASKAGMGKPVGTDRLKEAALALGIPVFGLGGINEGNLREVTETGASVALISAIMASPEPQAAARRIVEMTRRRDDTA